MAIAKMFSGTYISSITQNRVVLPKPFKDDLNSYGKRTFVVTMSPYGGLLLYPSEVFEDVCKRLQEGEDPINRDILMYIENYSMGGQSLEGTAGRFRISQELMNEAEITDKIKFIGRGNYISIWSLEKFEEHQRQVRDRIRNSTERSVVRL